MQVEKDEIFELAESYVNHTSLSVFLTGKAGTGKTTFLKHITANTGKRFVVLAPTGVAAINAGGSTIHSFFQLPLCPYLPDVKELITEYQMMDKFHGLKKERVKLIRSLELLIIDEVSMVRADLMDAIDMVLRRYRRSDMPFGGLQLLLIGDARQLSPVVTESERPYISQVYPSAFFFNSKAFNKLRIVTIELKKVYRQKDREFLDILNAVRDNTLNMKLLSKLNERVGAVLNCKEEPIRLTTHNRQAEEINETKLAALPGDCSEFEAEIDGDFPESSYPADLLVKLKPGAQVMFIRNDSEGEYYNGKIATVEKIQKDGRVVVKDSEGNHILVGPVDWENVKYSLDSSGEIVQNVTGVFRQIPLRTAWAITIHKSQGLTFDNVIIDAGSAFAFGQVYVALSRCRSLEGISLESPVRIAAIQSNPEVSRFNESMESLETVAKKLEGEEEHYHYELLNDVFDFSAIGKSFKLLRKLWQEHLKKTDPGILDDIEERIKQFNEASAVATRFRSQLIAIEAGLPVPGLSEASSKLVFLSSRLKKASEFFRPLFTDLLGFSIEVSLLDIGNKEVRRRVKNLFEDLLPELELRVQCLAMMAEGTFTDEKYCRTRTACLTGNYTSTKRKQRLKDLRKV